VRILTSSSATGDTFFDLALAVIERHAGPVRILTAPEQESLVAELVGQDAADQWPALHEHLGDPVFAREVAATVCAYQASFLGLEELRTHTHAAGEAERWEELAGFTDRYLAALDERGAVDWAGALVRASLLLRDPLIRAREVASLDALVVDDWETATFATNRLLSQLAGAADGVTISVAGNPATAITGTTGASPSYLARFPRRFAGAEDVRLDSVGGERPAATVIGSDHIGLALKAEADRGVAWEDMAVVVRDRSAIDGALASLVAADVPAHAESATTRWETSIPVAAGTVAVVTLETSPSRHWPVVAVAGCSRSAFPSNEPRWFDLHLLGGPDTPSPAERAVRAQQEAACAFELATSRATDRLLVAVGDDETGFSLPELPV
jgi:superfamily I DNA/RNA helicase